MMVMISLFLDLVFHIAETAQQPSQVNPLEGMFACMSTKDTVKLLLCVKQSASQISNCCQFPFASSISLRNFPKCSLQYIFTLDRCCFFLYVCVDSVIYSKTTVTFPNNNGHQCKVPNNKKRSFQAASVL